MASKSKKAKVNTEENEVLQTQIDISVNLARDLVHSWLPAAQPGEESDNDDDDITSYSQGRPGRIGLGAKYLSHSQATRHDQPAVGGPTSASDIKLRNKILNQNATVARKRRLQDEEPGDEKKVDSDDEGDSKTASVKDKKVSQQQPSTVPSGKPKKIASGDFLSMYLTEREGKKKKKKKKSKTTEDTA